MTITVYRHDRDRTTVRRAVPGAGGKLIGYQVGLASTLYVDKSSFHRHIFLTCRYGRHIPGSYIY
jgi:hypothetical protein